jgi:Ala-tRNA(Pro) deacylase
MTRGIEIVRQFLTDQEVPFEVIEHQDTFAAATEATVTGFDPHETAKTIILHDRAGFMAAVIPASERLDLHKARALLGGTGHLRLATEDEIERAIPDLELGALPPYPGLLALPEVLDRRLLDHERILCSGGDHRHSVILSPRTLDRLGAPLVGDICE